MKLTAVLAILWSCFLAFGAALVSSSMPRSPGVAPVVLIGTYYAVPLVQVSLFILAVLKEDRNQRPSVAIYTAILLLSGLAMAVPALL